jgi:hypothetical protein
MRNLLIRTMRLAATALVLCAVASAVRAGDAAWSAEQQRKLVALAEKFLAEDAVGTAALNARTAQVYPALAAAHEVCQRHWTGNNGGGNNLPPGPMYSGVPRWKPAGPSMTAGSQQRKLSLMRRRMPVSAMRGDATWQLSGAPSRMSSLYASLPINKLKDTEPSRHSMIW